MFSFFLSSFMIIIPVLVNVAFFTLLERKILGYSQSRKGPNKVAIAGLFQPFADAIKLFTKELIYPRKANYFMFLLSPIVAIFLVLMIWLLTPLEANNLKWNFSLFIMLVLMGLNLYPLLLAGWASNSKYATVGGLRGVAQTISYEISLALIVLAYLVLGGKISVSGWMESLAALKLTLLMLPLFFMWVVSCVAETNRTPFDFAEGESELVSGFNIEYGAGGFALIFMAEYASILFLSFLSFVMMSGQPKLSWISMVGMSLLGFWWVWLRATYPRYRYDMLMNLAWKTILPIALTWVIFCVVL